MAKMANIGGWFWYKSDKDIKFEREKCGKWMFFFDDQDFAKEMCLKAVTEDACAECKCTDMDIRKCDTGVTCFYNNGDNIEGHKKIINFMINNGLIRKTKTGKLYNISFKFDEHTRNGEYGSNFNGELKLSQFIDLETGEWIYE